MAKFLEQSPIKIYRVDQSLSQCRIAVVGFWYQWPLNRYICALYYTTTSTASFLARFAIPSSRPKFQSSRSPRVLLNWCQKGLIARKTLNCLFHSGLFGLFFTFFSEQQKLIGVQNEFFLKKTMFQSYF